MARALYRFIDGEFVEISQAKAKTVPTPASPYVIADDIGFDLKHPVTGEVTNSKCRWNSINKREKLDIVGNDLLSKKQRNIKDSITEEKVIEAAQRAESILSNPDKKREWEGRQVERYEFMQRHLRNGH